MKKIFSYLKHLLPWCVAALIFVYLFHLCPPSQVWQALTYVNLPSFSAFAVFYFAYLLFVDSWAIQKVICKFSHTVSFRDIVIARGVTYLVMIINYPASQAAFAYYLKRRYGIPIFQILGIFIFLIIIDLFWMIMLAFAGSFFQEHVIGGVSLDKTVQMVAIIAFVFTFIWLFFWRRAAEKIIGRPIRINIFEKLRRRHVFHIFNQATVGDYLRVFLMRLPVHFMIIISMYIILLTFNAHIPFIKVLGNLPIIFLAGTLPITPGGLGTVNVLSMELFSKYITGSIFAEGKITPKDLILASTILWEFYNYVLKVLLGTILLNFVSRKYFKPTPDITEEVAEHEAAHLGGNF